MVGQALYLEAEAAGIRGCGIGCFFDDPVHHLLGTRGLEYLCLYCFTIGDAIEYAVRLTTRRSPHFPLTSPPASRLIIRIFKEIDKRRV